MRSPAPLGAAAFGLALLPCGAWAANPAGLSIQGIALIVFLAFTALIITVFAWIARTTNAPREANVKAAYRLRRVLFISVSALAGVVIGFTLPRSPYASGDLVAERVVYVTVQQFGYTFSAEPVTRLEDLADVEIIDVLKLPADEPVEFRVTSLDVNHGFGIYDHDGLLIGQVQAMPGYVNRLRIRFPEPGQYEILCMEFCGVAHHLMRSVFVVTST
jgi:cytochrome c oxidase subunit 2